MHILCQSFRHLTSANVCNSVQGKTIIDLVILVQIFPNGVNDKTQKIRVLMHQ